jgi:hypothetical protein
MRCFLVFPRCTLGHMPLPLTQVCATIQPWGLIPTQKQAADLNETGERLQIPPERKA